MKRIYFILLSVLLLVSCPLLGQEKEDLVLDEEDKQFQEDLYLTDSEYFQKYVEKFEAADADFLYKSYIEMDDPQVKIFILRLALKKGLNEAMIFKIFDTALEEGLYNRNITIKSQIDDTWKVRAAAAYIIAQNPNGIEPKYKRRFVNRLIRVMKTDTEERCRGMAAICLGKLFANEGESSGSEAGEAGKKYQRYDVLNKDTIVTILNSRLKRISRSDQFFCWALVKAIGYLKSPKSFFVLLETRKKAFNDKVKLEISRSLDAIVGGSSASPTSP